ncbi:hypothetical protein [Bombilactobacillus bombi]|uniref:hypothetical protein n=1 Tax=Bombilactobacillus bombi TaxID=1303590 RepID=UPI0035E7E01C
MDKKLELQIQIKRLCDSDTSVIESYNIAKIIEIINKLDDELYSSNLEEYLTGKWIDDIEFIDTLESENFKLLRNPYTEKNYSYDIAEMFEKCAQYFNISLKSELMDWGITDFLINLTLEDKVKKVNFYFELEYNCSLKEILEELIVAREDVALGNISTLYEIYTCRKKMLARYMLVEYLKH